MRPEDVIIGFEQEYAISYQEEDKGLMPSRTYYDVLGKFASFLAEPTDNEYGNNSMGARIYVDRPRNVAQEVRGGVYHHLEAATPECRGAKQAALYARAIDAEVLYRFLRVARDPQQFSLPLASYHLIKASTDLGGNYWGCHRNFRIPRFLSIEMLRRYLVPFLVTKVIWAGQGGVMPLRPEWRQSKDVGVIFTLSPRALSIQQLEAGETLTFRPLLCTGRFSEHKSYDLLHWKRLQLIEGDSLLSDFMTYVEAGMTSLVLRLLSGPGFPSAFPYFESYQHREIVQDFHFLACDPTLETPIHFKTTAYKALKVQKMYLEAIWDKETQLFLTEEDKDVLARFAEILRLLEEDPAMLAGVSECWFKYDLFEKKLKQHNASWRTAHRILIQHAGKDILLRDYLLMLHHQLTALDNWGIWTSLRQRGLVETLFSNQEVEEARRTPPDTRAAWRMLVLKHAQSSGLLRPTDCSWSRIVFSKDEVVDNLDPTGRNNAEALREAEEVIRGITGRQHIIS